jgi:ABC-2 type transport system ATP-binding protein
VKPPAGLPILQAIGISKSYANRLALDDVSLEVRPGEIVGLLGPNGAGKTTTLSILSTLLRPDTGEVLVMGKPPSGDPRKIGRLLGLVPQSLALYPSLSAAQNLWHFARMQGQSRSEASRACALALEEVGLDDRPDDPMSTFSGGLARRLNLACGIVHQPAALLLDEPTVGVDVRSREQILALVRRRAQTGVAVIYSSHYMDEIERICDRALLIDRGRLIAVGSVEKLITLGGHKPRMELTYRGSLREGWSQGLPGVAEIAPGAREGQVTLEMASLGQVGELLERLRACGVNVIDFSLHSPNLSDAFITLTGRTLRDSVHDPA